MNESLLATIAADLAAARAEPVPATPSGQVVIILRSLPAVRAIAVVGFRLSHAAGGSVPVLGSLLKAITHVLTGADIDYRATIGPGLRILHPTGIVVAGSAVMGRNVTIAQGATVGGHYSGHVEVGDDVFIGPGSQIIRAVRIAPRVNIGANAVVVHDVVESDISVGGIPARIISH